MTFGRNFEKGVLYEWVKRKPIAVYNIFYIFHLLSSHFTRESQMP